MRTIGAVGLIVGTMAASGCVHASAKTAPTAPPLEMPAPPDRSVEVADAAPPPLPSAPSAPVVGEEPPRQPAPTPTRPPSRPAAPRAEAPPRQEPPAVEAPRAADEAPKPPATLQTTPAGAEAELGRAIQAVIARASGDLKRVDYRSLNRDGKTQYDTAKRFIEQADDALKKRNFVFARTLADKALSVAAQLAGR